MSLIPIQITNNELAEVHGAYEGGVPKLLKKVATCVVKGVPVPELTMVLLIVAPPTAKL